MPPAQLFPFGHGLSYAPASRLRVAARSLRRWPTGGSCQIEVLLRNNAKLPVSEVVQVYLHDPIAEMARPVRGRRVEPGHLGVLFPEVSYGTPAAAMEG